MFRAGADKNSIPLFAREQIEEVHTIAIPPFFGDDHAWRKIAAESAASHAVITVIPAERTDTAIQKSGFMLSPTLPEERQVVLVKIGRATLADAVLNGLIIRKDETHEIILQLIATTDSRILWWQAADFTFSGERPTPSDQKVLLDRMLSQFLAYAGKRKRPPVTAPLQPKPAPLPPADRAQKPEARGKEELQPRPESKKKPSRKPDRGSKPQPPSGNVSPM